MLSNFNEKLFVIFYNYKYKRAGELLKLKVGNFALIWQQRVDRGELFSFFFFVFQLSPSFHNPKNVD